MFSAQDGKRPSDGPAGSPPLDADSALRMILSATIDPTLMADAGGIIRVASAAIFDLLGWRAEELIGRKLTLLLAPPRGEECATGEMAGVGDPLRTRACDSVRDCQGRIGAGFDRAGAAVFRQAPEAMVMGLRVMSARMRRCAESSR